MIWGLVQYRTLTVERQARLGLGSRTVLDAKRLYTGEGNDCQGEKM